MLWQFFEKYMWPVLVVSFGIPLVLIIVLFFRLKSAPEHFKDRILPQEFSGPIVKRVFDDKDNTHKSLYIQYQNQMRFVSGEDWINLYEQSELGDSLIKESGIGYLTLLKKNGKRIRLKFDTLSSGRYY